MKLMDLIICLVGFLFGIFIIGQDIINLFKGKVNSCFPIILLIGMFIILLFGLLILIEILI